MVAGIDTKRRILESAERLFAQKGFAGTSLRAITREADVNLAAVHYHYGTKEELLRAVLNSMILPMNEERLRLLDQAEAAAAPQAPTVEAVLEAFLGPDLQLLERLNRRGPEVPRFISRSYIEGGPMMQELMAEQFGAVAHRFLTALERALPELGRDEIYWRMRCVVGVVIYLFANVETSQGPPLIDTEDLDGSLRRVVAFVAPGMSAPPVAESMKAAAGKGAP